MNRVSALIMSALVAAFISAKDAFAQGCASCYTTAAAGGAQTAHALRNGIVVLLVPPAVIFLGIIFLLRRWRTRTEGESRVPDRNCSMDVQNIS